GDIRGETLMEMILQEFPDMEIGFSDSKSLLETFPTGICCGLFPEIYPVKYKRKPRVPFEETCRHMGILLNRFERIETVEDHGRAEDTMFGNTEDGFIVVPVKND